MSTLLTCDQGSLSSECLIQSDIVVNLEVADSHDLEISLMDQSQLVGSIHSSSLL